MRNRFNQLTVPEIGIPNRLKRKIPKLNGYRYHGKKRNRYIAISLTPWLSSRNAHANNRANGHTSALTRLDIELSSVEVRPRESLKNHWALRASGNTWHSYWKSIFGIMTTQ